MKSRRATLPPFQEVPVWNIRAGVEPYRRDGESLVDTARRLLVALALVEAEGEQLAASRALGITPRELNYHLRAYGWRPKDRTTDDHASSPGLAESHPNPDPLGGGDGENWTLRVDPSIPRRVNAPP